MFTSLPSRCVGVPSNYPINLIDVSVEENSENFSLRYFRIERSEKESRDVSQSVVPSAAGCQGRAGRPAQSEHHQPPGGGREDGELALAPVQPGDGGEPLPVPRPQRPQRRELRQREAAAEPPAEPPAGEQHPEQPQARLDGPHDAGGEALLLQVSHCRVLSIFSSVKILVISLKQMMFPLHHHHHFIN